MDTLGVPERSSTFCLFSTVPDVSFPVVTGYSKGNCELVGSTSSSLLDRLKLRDEAAWQRLARAYSRLVFYWCRCAGIRREDRVDVCQEVFRVVAANVGGFRHDRPGDTFRGWLRTITRTRVADHFRQQNRQPTARGGSDAYQSLLAIPDGDASTIPEASDWEKAILVRGTLDSIRNEFEDRTWQAFWRLTVEGLQSGAVAEALNMTPAAVRQAKSRVLRRLREALNQLPEPAGFSIQEVDASETLHGKQL